MGLSIEELYGGLEVCVKFCWVTVDGLLERMFIWGCWIWAGISGVGWRYRVSTLVRDSFSRIHHHYQGFMGLCGS